MTRRLLTLLALGLLLVSAVGAFFVERFVARTLESEKLRTLISAKTGRVVGGDTGYLPITARGFSAFTPGVVGTGSPPRALTEIRVADLSAHFSLIELWRGKWRIDNVSARRAQIAYGPEATLFLDRSEFAAPSLVPAAEDESIMSVDVREATIAQTDLFFADPEKGGGAFRGVRTTFRTEGKNLIVQGSGGTFRQAQLPEVGVTRFQLYYEKPVLRVDDGHLALGDEGAISVRGGFRFEKDASLDLTLKFERCPINPFLTEGSRDKLKGTFQGETRVQKTMSGVEKISASGALSTQDLLVRNVAGLARAAAFTGESRLSPLRVDEVRGEDEWADGKLTGRKLRAEAKGLLCAAGNFTLEKGEIDGTFELGVAPEIAAKFPGAKEDVFTRAEGGYLWTTVKLSGSLSRPHDDLKPRLMKAIEKHFLGGILSPIFKPAKAAREVLEAILP